VSENPIFFHRQANDEHRKQRQTYQPQAVIAPHLRPRQERANTAIMPFASPWQLINFSPW
jgi:hypothetical protein